MKPGPSLPGEPAQCTCDSFFELLLFSPILLCATPPEADPAEPDAGDGVALLHHLN